MLAKRPTYMSNDAAAGIVLGGRLPVMLTSRADNLGRRLASVAVAVLLGPQATASCAQGSCRGMMFTP